jgi:hypothetical protein
MNEEYTDKNPKCCDRCRLNIIQDRGILLVAETGERYRLCMECSDDLRERKRKHYKQSFDSKVVILYRD